MEDTINKEAILLRLQNQLQDLKEIKNELSIHLGNTADAAVSFKKGTKRLLVIYSIDRVNDWIREIETDIQINQL